MNHATVHRKDETPTITVVTVVYNCVEQIEKTILSVINQRYPNIEYIVIDGGSTDGTVDVIRKYESRITRWVSERDTGIYNAMNKAVKLSTGTWINFMNAGDAFHNPDVVSRVAAALDPSFAVVAGAVCYVFDETHRRIKHFPLKFRGFYLSVPHHQASFINNALMKLHPYDESFRIRADLNLMTTLHAQEHRFRMIPEVICDVDTRGVSSGISKVHVLEEIRAGRVVDKHYGAKCLAYQAAYVVPRLLLRKVLPARLEAKIRTLVRG